MVSGRYLVQDDSIRVNGQIGLKPLLIRYFNIKGFISKHQDTKKRWLSSQWFTRFCTAFIFSKNSWHRLPFAITYGAFYIYTFFLAKTFRYHSFKFQRVTFRLISHTFEWFKKFGIDYCQLRWGGRDFRVRKDGWSWTSEQCSILEVSTTTYILFNWLGLWKKLIITTNATQFVC